MSDFHSQRDPNLGDRAEMAHELSDVKPRSILLFLVALVTTTVVVMGVLGVVMGMFSRVERKDEKLQPALYKDDVGQFPQPGLQETPRTDLARFREAERKITDTYGWVEGKPGVARIPLNRALDLLAEQGLPKGRNTPPRGARTRDQK